MADTDLVRFRIWTARKGKPREYYEVRIFPSRQAMFAYWGERGPEVLAGVYRESDSKWHARALGWAAQYSGRKLKRSRCAGEVMFYRQHLGAGIVSHEMTHLANYYLARKWDHYRTARRDEKLAWLQGWLVSQFWTGYYRIFPHEEPSVG